MRTLRTVVVSAALLIVVGAVVFLTLRFRVPSLSLPRLFDREPTIRATTVLETIRETAELQTVSGVYRVVFPHDFYLPDVRGLDLIARLAEGGESALSPEEIVHLDAYNIALASGLASSRDGGAFLVVTAVVTAGYRLDREPFAGLRDEAFFRPPGESSPPRMFLPEAQILDVRIEDMSRETYDYPETSVSPGDVQKISQFVRRHVEQIETTGELRATARAQSQTFFRALFPDRTNGEIEFSDKPLVTADELH